MNKDILNVTGNFISTELDYIEKCEKEKLELQQRIDKAIEYIKGKSAIINTDVIRIFDLFEIDKQGYTDKLLEILKGNSND